MDIIETDFSTLSEMKRHPWELARAAYIRRIFKDRFSGHDCRNVLDIGSGDCFTLHGLADEFSDIRFSGIDTAITEDQVEKLRSSRPDNITALYRDWNSVPDNETFDALIMLDVLEHIEDDCKFLRELVGSSRLRQGGMALITVPAFNSLYGSHDVNLRHCRRYNRRQLRDTASAAGLKIISCHYFFSSLIPLRLLSMCRKRKGGGMPEVNEWNHSSLPTRLIAGTLYADALLGEGLAKLNINLPGLSCLLIGRKQLS